MRIYSLLGLALFTVVIQQVKADWTPLHEAVHYARHEEVERLLQQGHPCSIEYLFLAIDRHRSSMNKYADLTPSVQALIKRLRDLGVSIDTKIPRIDSLQEWDGGTYTYDWSGKTALRFAFKKYSGAYPGNVAATYIPMIKALLEADADPNATDQEGRPIDGTIQPVSEEVKGYTGEDYRVRKEMWRLEQENRTKLRALLKHCRERRAEKDLERLNDEL